MAEVFGFVFATPQEARSFCCRLKASGITCLGRIPDVAFPAWYCFLPGVHPRDSPGSVLAVIAISGIGESAAYQASCLISDTLGVNWLVCAGVSGSLRSDLPAGSVIEASVVLDSSGRRWATDRLPGTDTHQGVAMDAAVEFCSPNILTRFSEKNGARSRWRADAVDMESAGVARSAAERRIGFSCVRAISDGVADDLPLDMTPFISGEGNVEIARLVMDALLHPRIIPGLLRLGFRTTAASRHLSSRLLVAVRSAVDTVI